MGSENKRMLYGGWGLKFGEIALPPENLEAQSSIRLYTIEELNRIFSERGMTIIDTSADYSERSASKADMQIQIYSAKNAFNKTLEATLLTAAAKRRAAEIYVDHALANRTLCEI